MVFKGPILFILISIAFVGGTDIFNLMMNNHLFMNNPFVRTTWEKKGRVGLDKKCPQLKKSVCDPEILNYFKKEMNSLKDEVNGRENSVKVLKELQKKIKEHDGRTVSRGQGSRGRSYIPTQDVENDMNALHIKVNNMTTEVKDILSFLTDNEVNDNNIKNAEPLWLRDKSQGVVKLEEIEKLEDRIAKMEERLSKLTSSNTLNNIEYMDILVESTINELTPKMNKLNTMEEKIQEVDVIKSQVSYLNRSYTRTAKKLQALEGNALAAYRQSLNLQRQFGDQPSFLSKKFERDLEYFMDDWTKNCSRSQNPCLAFTEEHLRFLSSDGVYSDTIVEKTVTPQVLGSLFWGCSPIVPETSPNLIIRRHWKEKMITFSCSKNKVLIGPKYILCHNRKWKPDAKPICKSRYTYVSIPSCPEIRLHANSSLTFEVNEQGQFVDFDCPEGHALRGPSRFWCRKGSWHPNIDPISECYTL